MEIRLRLGRSDGPEVTSYHLPSAAEAGLSGDWHGASVSTALQYLQRAVDPSLAYALSCRRGLCNVCAMRIDGEVRTACTTLVRDGMLVEPARDSIQIRDMLVELSLVRKARVQPAKEHQHAR
jgi:succinate dehydrogenase/fumarate reductase-like Fe-S protein